MSNQEFFNSVYAVARELGADHIRASIAAAQSANETGWGRYVKGNSFFGIKAGKSWQSDVIPFETTEFENGQNIKIRGRFRAYDGLVDSTRDYIKVISEKWPKTAAADSLRDAADALGNGVHGRYATNPEYENDVFVTANKRGNIAKDAYEGGGIQKPQLQRGDSGPAVSRLLGFLAKWEYYEGPQDGVFGGGTEAAIFHFQKDAGIKADGIVGPDTWQKLESWDRQASELLAPVKEPGFFYKNKDAIRDGRVTSNLINLVTEGCQFCYGEGCRIEVYSGGQPEKGTSSRRTGSVRHDSGRAMDVHIFKANGSQVKGPELSKLAQWWLATKAGSVGLEMSGGGIHLDEWKTPPQGGALSWTYQYSDAKPYAQTIKDALEAGKRGELPAKHTQNEVISPVKSMEDAILQEFPKLDGSQVQFILALGKYGALPEKARETITITNPRIDAGHSLPKKGTEKMKKSIFRSKTFWGIAGTLATVLFPPAGAIIDVLSPAAVDPLASQQAAEALSGAVDAINKLIATVSALFAIYGRMDAKGPATLKGV